MLNLNKKIKVAVLIGQGGRLPAIYQCLKRYKHANLVLVVSDREPSKGVRLAEKWGIESFSYSLKKWLKQGKSRAAFNKELARQLVKRKIDLVIMAGWDLVLSNEFLKRFPWRVMNIHPSLCPAFPGLNAEKQALDYGVKYTGCTLHFVPDEGIDTGPIIAQSVVKIEDEETVKSLQDKIHPLEEKLICRGIKAFAEGRIRIKNRKILIKRKKQLKI